jgi:hypothetical protein
MTSFQRVAILIVALSALLATSCQQPAQEQKTFTEPVLGQALRYVNPLAIEASSIDGSPQGVGLGDVSVIGEAGKYYMFCTGGGGWVSEDLVNWDYQGVEFVAEGRVPTAPHVVKFNDKFYMSGNNSPVYEAPTPLGPYESIGEWTLVSGEPWGGVSQGVAWDDSFDVDMFVDDDNTPYLYYAGRGIDGVYVVTLDPEHLNQATSEPKRLFGFDKSHIWERYGDRNEYSEVSWIEGPWMFKHNGTYYVQYSATGTQWRSYATGVYTSNNPMGPFTYSETSPLFRSTTGIVTGPAHGCMIEGPDGNVWAFYSIVMNNPPGGRRIGLDPLMIDASGKMVGPGRPSDTPQWGPGAVTDPFHNGDSGSLPLTIGKLRAMNAESSFSSERDGHYASYAIDDSNGTWWEPAANDKQPTLTLDLSSATRFDAVQMFTLDSARILFSTGQRRFFGGPRRGATPRARGPFTPPPAVAPPPGTTITFQYKIEASTDGENYTTVVDKTDNDVTKYIEFDEIAPTEARFVRLTITDWPRREDPLGVIEFTAFGKPIEQ